MSRVRAIGARRAALLAVVLATGALAGVGALVGATDALAYLLPALLLLGVLALRLYPGELTLAATLAARRHRHRHRPASVAVRRARPAHVLLARGGALVGSAIAVRPPPRPAVQAG